ncbi:MAG: hypothetical protein JJLCMIEE_02300 [Acidimicrobiales bacterium]|nr:hypothetical protein [Acidimicrobiales bacterium]
MNIDCVKSYVAAEGRRKVRHSVKVDEDTDAGRSVAQRHHGHVDND